MLSERQTEKRGPLSSPKGPAKDNSVALADPWLAPNSTLAQRYACTLGLGEGVPDCNHSSDDLEPTKTVALANRSGVGSYFQTTASDTSANMAAQYSVSLDAPQFVGSDRIDGTWPCRQP